MTIDCTTAREWLHDALDERLAAADRRAFDEHVAACGPCASEWETFRAIRATMRALGLPKAPTGLREAISAQIRAEPDAAPGAARVHRFVNWSRRLMIAASLLLAISLGWLFVDRDTGGREIGDRRAAGAAAPEPPRGIVAFERDARKESEPAGDSKKQGAAPAPVDVVEFSDAESTFVSNRSVAPAQTAGLPAVLPNDAEALRCMEVARSVARQWVSGADETRKSASAAPVNAITAGDRGRVAFFLTVLDQGTADLAATVPTTVGAGLEQLTKDADVALLGLGVHADPPVKQDSEVKLKSAADDRISTGPGAPVPGSPGEKRADLRERDVAGADEQDKPTKAPGTRGGGRSLPPAKPSGETLSKAEEGKSAKTAPAETGGLKGRAASPSPRGDAATKAEGRPARGGVAGGGGGGQAGVAPSASSVRRVDEPARKAAGPGPGFYALSGDQAIAKVGRLLEAGKLAVREVPLRSFELQARGESDSRLAFDPARAETLTPESNRVAQPQDRGVSAANAKYRVLEISVPAERFNSLIGDLESLDGVRLVPVGHEPSFATPEGERLQRRRTDAAEAPQLGAASAEAGLRTLRLVVLEP